ncbi:MAG: threonine synthase, partial [Prevotellaceae bacterium]|nr:threonine synthase [Prevotellaceae bacterium]
MKYYSTNKQVPLSTLKDAVLKGLADDNGLYMPERIPQLDKSFFENMRSMTFQEVACTVAKTLFGEDIEEGALKDIVYGALDFKIPLVKVTDKVYSLELFHGPTMA